MRDNAKEKPMSVMVCRRQRMPSIATVVLDASWSLSRNTPTSPDSLRDPHNYAPENIAVDVDAFNNPSLIGETAPNSLSIEAGTI